MVRACTSKSCYVSFRKKNDLNFTNFKKRIMKLCRQCGKEALEGDEVCVYCGCKDLYEYKPNDNFAPLASESNNEGT